jgi:Rrf2 family transcriptional regulator, nitric oxide-sensitive transcriptional repressor
MQLTKFTDYALRVLIFLAQRPRSTIHEIAETHRISENHLMKIVHTLAKRGYVETIRGKGGGLKLARPPERVTIGDVVRETEETLYVVECLAEDYAGDCRLNRSCRLKSVLRDAQNAFLGELDRYTLRDLLAKRGGVSAIDFHPRRGTTAG